MNSILAWEMPWTQEPGGLKSTGWQRGRRDLVTEPPQTGSSPPGPPRLSMALQDPRL